MTKAKDKTVTGTEVYTDEFLTVSESAALIGASTRTIERHATYTKTTPRPIFRNGRKINGYSKEWLLQHFKQVENDKVSKTTVKLGISDKDRTAKNTNNKRLSSQMLDLLREQNVFLTKEIQFKNEQIAMLQDSDKNTKTLLADLQLQQKTLLLNAPTAKGSGKKYTWVLAIAFLATLGAAGAVCYFGYENLLELLKEL